MKCPTCRHKQDHEIVGICTRCQITTSRQLHDIRATWYKAHGELIPTTGSNTNGSSEPKIGVNVAALSWVNGAPILNVLGEWEKLIRDERNLTPVGTITAHTLAHEIDRITRFHLAHLEWTADQPWASEYVLEVRELHQQGRTACRDTDEAGMRIDCPGELEEGGLCGKRLRIPTDAEATVYCKQCHTTWDQRRLAAVAMSVAEIEVMLPIGQVAALTGVPERTIRRWADSGNVTKRNSMVSVKNVITKRDSVA